MTNQNTHGFAQDHPDAMSCHDAKTLTNGGQTTLIRLGEQIYTLRITRAGKLILTK